MSLETFLTDLSGKYFGKTKLVDIAFDALVCFLDIAIAGVTSYSGVHSAFNHSALVKANIFCSVKNIST